MSQPDSKRPKTDKTDKKREFDVAVRAAKRAEWIGSCYEIKYLEEQVDTIDHIRRVAHLDMDEEMDLVIAQLHQKAAIDAAASIHGLLPTCATSAAPELANLSELSPVDQELALAISRLFVGVPEDRKLAILKAIQ